MKFIADLHIHSRHSIATSRKLDLEHLHIAAQKKGIDVVATGDITHPDWFQQVREQLVAAEPGMYRLNEESARRCDLRVPEACRAPVRFVLSTEISNVYKKAGRTRKNHNLVYLPDLDSVERLHRRLAAIGNIHSDGRPILGLDARDLLEIVLDTSDRAFLIPAHIWTPWFSVLGSKSGFDSLEACFDDLTPHIFAVETGLSSDPAMNWRVSFLDGITLVSNSDAHSPMKLGREANRFDTEYTFDHIREALRSGDPRKFLGTYEFYPQEGKYHLDGHRKCSVCSQPSETRSWEGRCPKCGKPLTCGVLHRVEELADRPTGVSRPKGAHPFVHLIPLEDVLGEIFQVGTGSKKVAEAYRNAIEKLGSELDILQNRPVEDISKAGIPLLGEAIDRIRKKQVTISPGYDGAFGTIRLFNDDERKRLSGQRKLFALPGDEAHETVSAPAVETDGYRSAVRSLFRPPEHLPSPVALNPEQRKAVRSSAKWTIVSAGPGTGKTLTLAHRIAHIVQRQIYPVDRIAAVTFTQKAAEEMRSRLTGLRIGLEFSPFVGTFHALCIHLLADWGVMDRRVLLDEREREKLVVEAIRRVRASERNVGGRPRRMLERISRVKIRGAFSGSETEENGFQAVYRQYHQMLADWKRMDFDDLIVETLRLLEDDAEFRDHCRSRYPCLLVDEYQDLDSAQYRLVRMLKSENGGMFAIGDPDQSIYGFRGSSPAYFQRFPEDFKGAVSVRLTTNYRSVDSFLKAAYQILPPPCEGLRHRVRSEIGGKNAVELMEAGSGRGEAIAIGRRIEKAVGGSGFYSVDFGKVDGNAESMQRSFSDFAVLVRTTDQLETIRDVMEKGGIPTQLVSRKHTLENPAVAALISLMRFVAGEATPLDLDPLVQTVFPKALSGKHLHHFKCWCLDKRMPLQEGIANTRRIPMPGLGVSDQEKLLSFFEMLRTLKKENADQSIERILVRLRDQTRLSALFEQDPAAQRTFQHLLERSTDFGNDVAAFLTSASLHTDADVYDPLGERVALMTMHASKGLEFPVVFIAGCEKGWVPLEPEGRGVAEEAEERRLFFVAMTRAREELYLSWSRKRQIRGAWTARSLSPIVKEIDPNLLVKVAEPRSPRVRNDRRQLSLF